MTTITELKKLAEAATPGPWSLSERREYEGNSYGVRCKPPIHSIVPALYIPKANAQFIAAANPATILTLLSVMEEMASALDTLMIERGSIYDQALARYKELCK